MENENNFGYLLKRFRLDKKHTIRELAAKSKLSHTYISQLENGKRNPPKRTVIKDISEGLSKLPDENTFMYEQLLEAAGYRSEWSILYQTSKENIIESLKLLTDDEGYFYDFLKEDVFNAITSNLYMAVAYHTSREDEEYENYFNHYFSANSDELSKLDHEESVEVFNKAYDIRTVIKAINSSFTNIEELEGFNSALKKIIKKHGFTNSKLKKQETDLKKIIEIKNLTYNNHLINNKEKHLIKSYLEALFSSREGK